MSIPCPQHACCEQSAGSSIVCCLGPWEQGERLGLTALEELSSQAPCVGELRVLWWWGGRYYENPRIIWCSPGGCKTSFHIIFLISQMQLILLSSKLLCKKHETKLGKTV